MVTPKAGHGDSDEFTVETKRKLLRPDLEEADHVHPPMYWSSMKEGEQVLRDLQYLLGRGDGWMRWTSDLDGKVLFLKYKFTSIRWPNHYVFVSGPIWDVALMVSALVRKCEKVDAGQLQPTMDKPYNHM